jgi:hypothetical protein
MWLSKRKRLGVLTSKPDHLKEKPLMSIVNTRAPKSNDESSRAMSAGIRVEALQIRSSRRAGR